MVQLTLHWLGSKCPVSPQDSQDSTLTVTRLVSWRAREKHSKIRPSSEALTSNSARRARRPLRILVRTRVSFRLMSRHKGDFWRFSIQHSAETEACPTQALRIPLSGVSFSPGRRSHHSKRVWTKNMFSNLLDTNWSTKWHENSIIGTPYHEKVEDRGRVWHIYSYVTTYIHVREYLDSWLNLQAKLRFTLKYWMNYTHIPFHIHFHVYFAIHRKVNPISLFSFIFID